MNEADPSAVEGRTISEEFDRNLIEGLRNDDRTAMVEAYDVYGGIAYALASRVMGASKDAEDVVQDSFLALWRQAPRLEATRGVRSYLLTIVHHKAVDRIRTSGRHPEVVLDEDAPFKAADSEQPETIVTAESERERVRDALTTLSEDQRRAVELTYFAGLTINEAATRLNVPLGTVKSRLRLALGHLKRNLEGTS